MISRKLSAYSSITRASSIGEDLGSFSHEACRSFWRLEAGRTHPIIKMGSGFGDFGLLQERIPVRSRGQPLRFGPHIISPHCEPISKGSLLLKMTPTEHGATPC
jgi:hypothetical protein